MRSDQTITTALTHYRRCRGFVGVVAVVRSGHGRMWVAR